MPDWVTKTSRRAASLLGEGEELRAALFARPRPGDDAAAKFGTPGGALGRLERFADPVAEAGRAGLAARFPGTNVVLGLTDDRLLVFGHGTLSGRVKAMVAEFARDELVALSLSGQVGAAATSLRIEFADGSSVSLTPGSRAARFVEAFEGSPASA